MNANRLRLGTLLVSLALGLLLAPQSTPETGVPEQTPTVTLRLFDPEPILGGIRATLRFRNWTETPQVVFLPGDGSFDGRQEPTYSVELVSANGEVSRPRCDSCRPMNVPASAKWPTDYQVVLAPRSTFAFTEEWHFDYKQEGVYQLRAAYEFRGRRVLPASFGPAWQGRTNTAETMVRLPKPW
ncbi:MAG: hypothetical protein ACRC8S_22015 [Fimbriiglobus sp.]